MGYASIAETEAILSQALTSARPDGSNQKIKLINIGETRDPNRIPTDIVEFYISLADKQIDGILSEMYETPLKKCAHGQWDLDSDLNEYNQVIEISDATALIPGDEVIIRDNVTGTEELHIVQQVLDQNTFTVFNDIESTFEAANSRVIRIGFPPPVTQISARYASGFIFDKYYSAGASPNMSEYGEAMKTQAMNQLNDILNGKVIIKEPCARRIGDRFGDPYPDSAYAHRTPVDGYNTQDRNMSRV